MSMTTSVKTVLGAAIASLTLLTLAASPSLADTHNKTATPTDDGQFESIDIQSHFC